MADDPDKKEDRNSLAPEKRQKFIDHLNDKAPSLRCPACSSRQFSAGEHLLSGTVISPSGSVILSGTSYPAAFLVCQNCFYVMSFAAVPIGLIDPPPEKKRDG